MKVLFIRGLSLTTGMKDYSFQRMKVYDLPEAYAFELMSQGFCVAFGLWGMNR